MEETFGEVSKKLNLFEKVFYSLIHPGELFNIVRNEPFLSSFWYMLFVGVIGSLMICGLIIFINVLLGGMMFMLLFFVYGILILFSFMSVGIYHIFAQLLGSNYDYDTTYKAYVYGYTPFMLFFGIPIINILAIIYGSYLFIRGISILHGFSIGKSFLVWFLPLLLIGCVFILLVLLELLIGLPNLQNFSYLNQTGGFIRILKVVTLKTFPQTP
jgi:hypothetical protein